MGHSRASDGISKGGQTIRQFEQETVIYGTAKLFFIPTRHSKSTKCIKKQFMRNKDERTANMKTI
jgi:hypothetical protein